MAALDQFGKQLLIIRLKVLPVNHERHSGASGLIHSSILPDCLPLTRKRSLCSTHHLWRFTCERHEKSSAIRRTTGGRGAPNVADIISAPHWARRPFPVAVDCRSS